MVTRGYPQRMVERMIEIERDFQAALHGAVPQRIMLGMDQNCGQLGIEWRNGEPLTDASKRETIEQLKKHGPLPINAEEATSMTTNIDRKDFVTKPVSVRADSLAARHLGSLVTIQTTGNAEVTDILRVVHADTDRGIGLLVGVENLRTPDTFGRADFVVDPKSTVLVRKPKPVAKAAPKK